MKKFSTIIIIFVGLIIVVLYLGAWASSDTEKRELPSKPSFSKKDKIKYGTFVLFERLQDIFPQSKIQIAKKPLSEFLTKRYYSHYSNNDTTRNYIFINDEINFNLETSKFDKSGTEISYLKDFVKDGNHVFLAAESFSEEIKDFLQFDTNNYFEYNDDSAYQFIPFFRNPNLKNLNPVKIQALSVNNHFTLEDDADVLVHATDMRNNPVLIEIQYGEEGGSFILSSTPTLFTNYFLLKDKQSYAQIVAPILSLMEDKSIVIWDEYYKVENLKNVREGKTGDWMRFIRNQPPLAWGFYLTLVLSALYVLTSMKRVQRIIPIIEPLKNSTLDFAETIGRLYFQSQNHHNIAEKKTRFFLEFVRNRFYMKTQVLDEEFCEVLANKSHLPLNEVKSLVNYIAHIRKQGQFSEEQLKAFSAKLDYFYEEAMKA